MYLDKRKYVRINLQNEVWCIGELEENGCRVCVVHYESEECISTWSLNPQRRSIENCMAEHTSPIHSSHFLAGVLPYLQLIDYIESWKRLVSVHTYKRVPLLSYMRLESSHYLQSAPFRTETSHWFKCRKPAKHQHLSLSGSYHWMHPSASCFWSYAFSSERHFLNV